MMPRRPWQGVATIVGFNWPFYLAATVAGLGSFMGALLIPRWEIRLLCGLGAASSAYFVLVSLGVSHWVYDLSDLYRWGWLERALKGAERRRFLFCYTGFDEASVELRERFPSVEWQVLDHYDEIRMTEASIRRARRQFPPPPDTVFAAYNQWPVSAATADVVLGLLAIHELRSDAERCAWLSEARRCLMSGGRVILVEHLRDAANLLAFGPGVLHFHSRASWYRCWERAGFRLHDEFQLTHWVRVFVIVTP